MSINLNLNLKSLSRCNSQSSLSRTSPSPSLPSYNGRPSCLNTYTICSADIQLSKTSTTGVPQATFLCARCYSIQVCCTPFQLFQRLSRPLMSLLLTSSSPTSLHSTKKPVLFLEIKPPGHINLVSTRKPPSGKLCDHCLSLHGIETKPLFRNADTM